MPNLFDNAALFFPAINTSTNPKRAKLIEELEKLLDTSAFLMEGEKANMRKEIPIFNDEILLDLKESLIRENLRSLQKKLATN